METYYDHSNYIIINVICRHFITLYFLKLLFYRVVAQVLYFAINSSYLIAFLTHFYITIISNFF